VEQLAGLRAIPDLTVFRPADSRETAAGWVCAMTHHKPTLLVTTRQDLPLYEGSGAQALKGGYVISQGKKAVPDVILMASGSEVEPCVQAQAVLAEKGVDARVVSMPAMDLFDEQSDEYKESVLPKAVRARVAIEAASPMSWYKYVGLDGEVIGMTTFGASAPYKVLFPHFGLTTENVVEKALKVLK
jgi:transketolase